MNYKNKAVIVIVSLVSIFVFTPLIFAASSDFLAKATEYYERNCRRNPNRLSQETSLNCYLFDKVSELDQVLSNLDSRLEQHEAVDATQSSKIAELEERISVLETLPSPTPEPLVIQASWNTTIDIPTGYKSMTIDLASNQFIGDWAPNISFDGGATYWEQIRRSCGGNSCSLQKIPILSNKYKFTPGSGTNPDIVDIDLTLYQEQESSVLVLGQEVNYPFSSASFNADGFDTISLTAGGGDNPQNLIALNLEKLIGGVYTQVGQVVCDHGAVCPFNTLNLAGGEYRVSIEGNGTKANLGAILR